MGRGIHKLTALAVAKTTAPGRHPDGGNLYLQVSRWGTKAWVFRYRSSGKDRHHGIGPYPLVTLAAARERAVELRRGLLQGADPIKEKQAARVAAGASRPTFQQIAEAYLADHEKSWSNPVHRAQWRSTLSTYAYPVIGTMAVADITTDHVLLP